MYLEVIAVLHYSSHDGVITPFMRVSCKFVFHQSKCISAIQRIHSTTATYISSSSFMYLCIPCYCDACLKSITLRVGVKTSHNTVYRFDSIHVSIRFRRDTERTASGLQAGYLEAAVAKTK